MSLKEYKSGTTFPGIIERTADESTPAWPEPLRAAAHAANVLFIVLDDTGFGQLGCFGGQIRTPNLDKLAAGGLRFNNMHTTALCSPSRSCFLTGRNHHSNAMAGITEISTGFPGYNGAIPFENGLLSEMLLQYGYNTYAVGKWHLTPAEQLSAAGPYDRWPLGRGFERYYGFLGGDTSQYYPELVYDNHPIDPPRTPEEGYHLTEDLVDKAIEFVGSSRAVAPDKPFFLYFATGAMHAPHQVPREWADRYVGQFDMGWDKAREVIHQRQLEMGILPPGTALSSPDPDVAPWDTLSPDERRLYARMMEVYAGFLEHTDHQIGRLLAFLEKTGALENTLVIAVSDNGASAEGGQTGSVNELKFFNFVPESLDENLAAIDELGGPKHFNHYPWGWTHAGNTPFRRWKRETYRGGVSDPLIVHWPTRLTAQGEIRQQYVHAIDFVPTVLELLGLEPPTTVRGVAQSPIEGISFAYALKQPDAASRHRTQYFEMMGHRSLYHDGWRAVCPWPGPSFVEAGKPFGTPLTAADLKRIDSTGWELYHVETDFSETKNLAADPTLRDKLIELISIWYVEAGKYKVLPIDGRGQERLAEPRPQISGERSHYVYYPKLDAVPENAAPKLLNRSHQLQAKVVVPSGGADGVLLCQGGNSGGFTFFVLDRKLYYIHNFMGSEEFELISNSEVPEGSCELRYAFEVTGPPEIRKGKGAPGIGRLYFDGRLVGEATFAVTTPVSFALGAGLLCGRASLSPITRRYHGAFEYSGKIEEVVVEVSGGAQPRDTEAELRMALARQ